MRIVFDQGVPAPLRDFLTGHAIRTAHELGWSTLRNGELLSRAEKDFDLLITTDRNMRQQQNLAGSRLAILVLPTTSWPRLRAQVEKISAVVATMSAGQYEELST